ncbi:hypothetical protein [Haladaptatus sp. CMSO5]|uniref:hypothetical protein n=1 Tax=Haladaptatus sp. CMSO5 TaxID=3120514 RepID=UPI002FCDF629
MWVLEIGLEAAGVETGMGDLVAAAVIWMMVLALPLLLGKAYDFCYDFFNPVVEDDWE